MKIQLRDFQIRALIAKLDRAAKPVKRPIRLLPVAPDCSDIVGRTTVATAIRPLVPIKSGWSILAYAHASVVAISHIQL